MWGLKFIMAEIKVAVFSDVVCYNLLNQLTEVL